MVAMRALEAMVCLAKVQHYGSELHKHWRPSDADWEPIAEAYKFAEYLLGCLRSQRASLLGEVFVFFLLAVHGVLYFCGNLICVGQPDLIIYDHSCQRGATTPTLVDFVNCYVFLICSCSCLFYDSILFWVSDRGILYVSRPLIRSVLQPLKYYMRQTAARYVIKWLGQRKHFPAQLVFAIKTRNKLHERIQFKHGHGIFFLRKGNDTPILHKHYKT